jgi:hypothetical protein
MKMNPKKWLLLLVAGLMLVAVAGCSDSVFGF